MHKMLVYILISSAVLLWYLQFRWSRRRLNYLASQVPGPKPWPIIGNALEIMWDPSNVIPASMRICDLYPDISKYWVGHLLFYAVYKPEYLEVILNSQHALSKAYIYKFMEPLLGWGLLTAPVPIWKRHRKIITPSFNNRILQAGVNTINEESMILVREILKKSGNGFFDVSHHTLKCTLDIFCGTSMGLKTHTQTNDTSNFYKNVERMIEIVGLRLFHPRYHLDFLFKFSKVKREVDLLVTEFDQVSRRLVQERKKHCHGRYDSKRKIFLDMLLEASNSDENKLSDVEIRDEVNTFIFGGSDTVSQACSFLMVLLGMHPDVQDKVYSEVLEVVGDEDAPILWEHLSQLKYTEKVIKETLRLFPPGSSYNRDTNCEIRLDDGIILPSGSSIILNIIHLHRNAKYWPDPLKFDPERFEPGEISKRHPYSYLPFSGGPRNCPGMRYAMMTLKIMVGWLVRKIKFSTQYSNVEDVKLKMAMFLAPVDGYLIAVEKR